MCPRRRIQTDVPESEDTVGCRLDGGSRRMSPRQRIQTDVQETEVPDGCSRDGGSRRMSLRRRIETDVPKTEVSVCVRVSVSLSLSGSVLIQSVSFLSCYLFTFC